MKYPEWVVPEWVDKAELLLEVQRAIDYYENTAGCRAFLCDAAEYLGVRRLSRVLSVTLVGDDDMTLEDHIERINGIQRYHLTRRNSAAHVERRVIWLNLLKEKLS